MAKLPKPEELSKIDLTPPENTTGMDTRPWSSRKACSATDRSRRALGDRQLPESPGMAAGGDADWKLPENWKEILPRGDR